ncbi:MAG: HipA family kinase [Pseudomonadota bacterium]
MNEDNALRVVKAVRIFENSSSKPMLVQAGAYGRSKDDRAHQYWVVKLAGSGQGPVGLLTELIASKIARAFGIKTPDAKPIWLPHDFPWQIGTDEFDEMLQRSYGWNLALRYVKYSRVATMSDVEAMPASFLRKLLALDTFLHNVDRTIANTNLLIDARGQPVAIDHGSVLFISRALQGGRSEMSLAKGHLLAGTEYCKNSNARPSAEAIDWRSLLADVPDDWIGAAGTDRSDLARALRTYAESYDEAQFP